MASREDRQKPFPFPVLYNATFYAGPFAYSSTKKRNRFVNQVMFLSVLQQTQQHSPNEPYAVIADAQYGETREDSASWWEMISRLPTEWRQKYVERLTPWYKNPNSRNNVTAWIVDMSGVDALVTYIYGKYVGKEIQKVKDRVPISIHCGSMGSVNWDNTIRDTAFMKTFPACCGVGVARSIRDPSDVVSKLKGGVWRVYDQYRDWYNPSWSFVLIETDPEDEEYENNMEVIRSIKRTTIPVWSSKSYKGRKVHAVALYARNKVRHIARRKERNNTGAIWE